MLKVDIKKRKDQLVGIDIEISDPLGAAFGPPDKDVRARTNNKRVICSTDIKPKRTPFASEPVTDTAV
ncbi:MAG: hypothetical protein AAGF94_11155 [Pseudomonadota bacterium]